MASQNPRLGALLGLAWALIGIHQRQKHSHALQQLLQLTTNTPSITGDPTLITLKQSHIPLFTGFATRYLTQATLDEAPNRTHLNTLTRNENLAQWSPTYHLYKLARRITGAA